MRDSFCEEIEHVFDKFSKYHMKMMLGNFSSKLGREDIFKPTIRMKVYTKLVTVVELEQ
jgi:hypothetical protein